MVYAIDRIFDGIAVCESLDSGDNFEIAICNLPPDVKEGDIIRRDADGYVVDTELTKRRKVELTAWMERLLCLLTYVLI